MHDCELASLGTAASPASRLAAPAPAPGEAPPGPEPSALTARLVACSPRIEKGPPALTARSAPSAERGEEAAR